MVSVYFEGMDENNLNLTIAGYRKREKENLNEVEFDDFGGPLDENQGWTEARIFKTFKFKITQGVDVFAPEVQQKELIQFTERHDTNQIICLFTGHLFAVELDDNFSRLISSEVMNNLDYDIDLIAGLPDNGRGVFYS